MATLPTKSDDLLSLGETAHALGITYKQLWNWTYRDDKLPKPKARFGRRSFFKKEQLPILLSTLADQRMMKGGV